MSKAILISICASLLLIFGAFWFASKPAGVDNETAVSVVDGKQLVDITAKGGYSPRVILAKAGVPTTLRVNTRGTFDCSASLVIPKLQYQKFLSPTGTEEIPIPAEQAQGTMQGLCSMGMYNFQIKFQ
ncbi:MAG: Copper-transporting P-type ATPase (Modular protein) [Candidatus Giovannonibacteria bacterium GW2011_GWA2_53_7]|uniref:Copper-transporting P-type ATPase (Modular protein) n=1 Tax=Candidatus Giovannonibacteria bacterium GW2011_GWA2_53_7 TaxID=1618650 RepID=A0A0G2APF3_9BACT|nr:MAG: Copper-transporting P-type ATPase (Modular protein) [Candidatus Giovannonibacteria bacterium GW2011_GWA2_53_7]